VPIPALLELLDPDATVARPHEVDAGKVRADRWCGHDRRLPRPRIPATRRCVAPYVVDAQQSGPSRARWTRSGLRADAPARLADVEVLLDARDNVLRVPSYALLDGKKALVLREGKLVAAPVEVGLKNWGFAEVKGGLTANDLVVVSLDRAEVKEGARARVAEETTK
jgi:HlyD family secretion protein